MSATYSNMIPYWKGLDEFPPVLATLNTAVPLSVFVFIGAAYARAAM